jgi:hypothetical protein
MFISLFVERGDAFIEREIPLILIIDIRDQIY